MDGWGLGEWLTLLFSFMGSIGLIWQILRNEGMQPSETLNLRWDPPGNEEELTDPEKPATVRLDISPTGGDEWRSPRIIWNSDASLKRGKNSPNVLKAKVLSARDEPLHLEFRQQAHSPVVFEVLIDCSSPIMKRPVCNGWRITLEEPPKMTVHLSIEKWYWYRTALPRYLVNDCLRRLRVKKRMKLGRWRVSRPYWKSAIPADALLTPRAEKS